MCIHPRDHPTNYWEEVFGKLCKMVDDAIHAWSVEAFFFQVAKCKLQHAPSSTIRFNGLLCLHITNTMSMGKETSEM